MIASSHTYRRISAVLVFSLLLSIGLPLIQQVCAQGFGPDQTEHMGAHEHAAVEHCCCEHPEDADHPMPLGEDCHDEAVTLKGVCCNVEIKQADGIEAFLSDRSASTLVDASVIATGEIVFADDEDETTPKRIAEASPPPTSVSLHVLHETFLN